LTPPRQGRTLQDGSMVKSSSRHSCTGGISRSIARQDRDTAAHRARQCGGSVANMRAARSKGKLTSPNTSALDLPAGSEAASAAEEETPPSPQPHPMVSPPHTIARAGLSILLFGDAQAKCDAAVFDCCSLMEGKEGQAFFSTFIKIFPSHAIARQSEAGEARRGVYLVTKSVVPEAGLLLLTSKKIPHLRTHRKTRSDGGVSTHQTSATPHPSTSGRGLKVAKC